MALLVFVDFGGSSRTRLRAYLLLLVAGAVLIALGTLCSHATWLATIAMGVVAFAIVFAGVLNGTWTSSRSSRTSSALRTDGCSTAVQRLALAVLPT
jgi:hypothetical protein